MAIYQASDMLTAQGQRFAWTYFENCMRDAWDDINSGLYHNGINSADRLRGCVGMMFFLSMIDDKQFSELCEICSGWATYCINEQTDLDLKDLFKRQAE